MRRMLCRQCVERFCRELSRHRFVDANGAPVDRPTSLTEFFEAVSHAAHGVVVLDRYNNEVPFYAITTVDNEPACWVHAQELYR